ncbi:MarC family protein [Aquabacter sp. CN5-332]|uniref:MarC family protein n=1 Tax=Aquabacter sp. CN5-332 TaxID=3156608 RepID=UPI0032B3E86D
MTQAFNIFLAVFAALFPVVNPLGGAPIFYQMTRYVPAETQARMARRVALYGFVLLVVSMALGSHILSFFGISLPVLRVAGGLVVTFVGWQLLHQGNPTPERDASHTVDAAQVEDQTFYPITMPLTTGPGSIATAVALGAQADLHGGTPAEMALVIIAALCGLIAVAASIYVAYRYAGDMERVLGPHGTNILVRLFAFILLCIGMQIMWTGLSALLGSVVHPA